MIQTELEHPEPQVSCNSCWYYEDIRNSWSSEVMHCHYQGEPHEDYEICDDYEIGKTHDTD